MSAIKDEIENIKERVKWLETKYAAFQIEEAERKWLKEDFEVLLDFLGLKLKAAKEHKKIVEMQNFETAFIDNKKKKKGGK